MAKTTSDLDAAFEQAVASTQADWANADRGDWLPTPPQKLTLQLLRVRRGAFQDSKTGQTVAYIRPRYRIMSGPEADREFDHPGPLNNQTPQSLARMLGYIATCLAGQVPEGASIPDALALLDKAIAKKLILQADLKFSTRKSEKTGEPYKNLFINEVVSLGDNAPAAAEAA